MYTKHGLSACISKQVIALEVPRLRQGRPRKMESLRFLTVMSTILPGTAVTYNDTTNIYVFVWGGYTFWPITLVFMQCLVKV